jgi:hopanoid biosynthesis associated RND transporter like protein HpnN
MLTSATVRLVDFCARRRWPVIAIGTFLLVVTAAYDISRFSIDTNVNALVSATVPWQQRLAALTRAFPENGIAVVVRAPTPEGSEQATDALAEALAKEKPLLSEVLQPDSGAFFAKNRFLFQSVAALKGSLHQLEEARPLLTVLAADPSLRGLSTALSQTAKGVAAGKIKPDQLATPLTRVNATLTDVLAGRPAEFSWQDLTRGASATADELRHVIQVQPTLDYGSLQPGHQATEAIARHAQELKLGDAFGAQIAQTGQVPMNDDEFVVISHSLPRDTLIAVVGVLIVLWLALRSWKLIAAVFFSLLVGLAVTAALGLLMLGAFNLISIAFFVLFVGLGVDFGIQFSVRYRSQRHEHDDLHVALRSTAHKVAVPLSLAAAATAIGFFSFLPTSYVGLSQLGLVAGCGMIVAFLCSLTLVPAALAVLNPPGEPEAVGFTRLAPVDALLQRHRVLILAVTAVVVLAGAPALAFLRFDFNPIDLQDPTAPSVVAYKDLQDSPASGGMGAEVLAPSLQRADDIARRLARLPQVAQAVTLSQLIPTDQEEKLALVRDARAVLAPALDPAQRAGAPSDAEDVAALRKAATDLSDAVGDTKGQGALAARRTAALLEQVAQASGAMRQAVVSAFLPPLAYDLAVLRTSLEPKLVTKGTLPGNLLRSWELPDGRARVEVIPKLDPNNAGNLADFAKAVLAAEPSASGPGIGYYESKQTVVTAFVEAAVIALAAIAVLLFIALRRARDVLLTLVPLLLAGAVALEVCALSDFPLNFANVIALPLLLGVGVAFKIYYVVAWRAGKTGLLQSTLTRAVVFSALTNAIAFGSLWSSSNPGMSSMGALMFLALLCTLAAAVVFQPVLMGQPRQVAARLRRAYLREAGE